jgi:hypothetical protein
MDKHMDDFCEGKTLRETPKEVLNARRKRNEEMESIGEKTGHQLPSWDPHLLVPAEQDETEH